MEAPRFSWTSAALSDVGLVRRINEDACLDLPERGLWAVADGIGGHAFGEVASKMVIEVLEAIAPTATLAQFVAAVRVQLQVANQNLREIARRRAVALIGSTVVVLLAAGGDCAVLWAGDSRIYLLRQGALLQLTRDHSQQVEQRDAAAAGEATVYDAMAGANVITRAVGAADTLVLDEHWLALLDGDVFLLCSDGLNKEVSDAEIARALVPGNCRHASQALIALALQHGGHDNVSVVVACAEDLCSVDKTVLNPAF